MTHPSAAVEISDLTVRYPGSPAPVVDHVSFSVPTSVVMGLVGPNGAGKSTLFKAALGLVPAAAGTARFFGQPLDKVRRRVAYMPQSAEVDWDFPVTVENVVAMGLYPQVGWLKRWRRVDRDAVHASLERVGVESLAKRQISELSGGQRRRVFVARILAQQPDIYLLDEPFAGVDAASERIIRGVLEQLRNSGATVMVVHHDLGTVREFCDQVALINRSLVAAGPTAEIFNSRNLNAAFGLGMM